jgi:hypothetical protein
MKTFIALLAAAWLFNPALMAPVLAAGTLEPGTPVLLTVDKEVDADDVKLGETVNFMVQQPVKQDGVIIIPANTPAMGTVTKRKNNFIFGVAGAVEVENIKLHMVDNSLIPIKATVNDKGNSRHGFLFGLLLWITLPLIFVKGEDGKIAKGTEVLGYTAQEIAY